MNKPTKHIVMTASEPQRGRKWGEHKRVAVVEIEEGARPAMISERARGVVRIVELWEGLRVGKTERSQYARALAEAEALCAQLNEEASITARAREVVSQYGDDEDAGPSGYDEAAAAFHEVFGREPDDEDGDAGDLWSHVCAAAEAALHSTCY